MEKDCIRNELVSAAQMINHVARASVDINRHIDEAQRVLQENMRLCSLIGVDYDEGCALELKEIIRRVCECRELIVMFERTSMQYLAAMEQCGIPMSPADPHLQTLLGDTDNFFSKEKSD